VQAWALLQEHHDFAWLTVAALRRLEERLLVHIRCYGYVCLFISAPHWLFVLPLDTDGSMFISFGGVIKLEFLQGLLNGRQ
jgi:hypothetical protein